MDVCPIPLVGQAWLLAGFDYAFDPDVDPDNPEIYAAGRETPLLVIAEALRGNQARLEQAFCTGIIRLYVQRYGLMALVQGIQAWESIVASLGTSRENAAD